MINRKGDQKMDGITERLKAAIFSALVLTLMFIPVPGQAQGQNEPQQAAPAEIGEAQILAFANAQNQVVQIQQKYNAVLAEVKDAQQQQNITQKFNDEMVVIIQNTGLTVELYNTILTRAQTDEQLKARIIQAMQSLQ